ncbi:MAG: hypothetical protein ABEN55_00605 [Bradymonadaceae bacterium]
MATTVRELLVEFGVDADQEAMARINDGINDVKSGLKKITQVATVATAALGGLGAGLVREAKRAAEWGDEALKSAHRTGLAADQVQRLRHAAQLSDADLGALQRGLKRLGRTANDAEMGLSTAQDAFAQLNLDWRNAQDNLKSVDRLLLESAERISELDSKTQKLALAQELFGRGGAELLPLLNQGKEGIRGMMQEADQLGLTMERQTAEAGRAFLDNLTRLKGTISGLRRSLGAELIPVLNDNINAFREWILANREMIRQRIEDFASRAEREFELVADAVKRADKEVQKVGGWIELIKMLTGALATFGAVWSAVGIAETLSGLGKILSGLATKLVAFLTSSAAAIAALWSQIQIIFSVGIGTWLSGLAGMLKAAAASAAIFLAKVIAIVAALAAVVLLIEDFIVFLQGGDSLIGVLVERFKEWIAQSGALQDTIKSLIAVFAQIGRIVRGVVLQAWRIAKSAGLAAFEAIKQIVLTLGTVFEGVFRAFKTLAVPVFRLLLLVGRAVFMGIAAVVGWLWTNALKPFVTTVADWFVWLFGGLKQGFVAAGKAIRGALSTVFGWLTGKLETVASWINWMRDSLASLLGIKVGEAAEKVESAADKVEKAQDDEDDDGGDDKPGPRGGSRPSGGSGPKPPKGGQKVSGGAFGGKPGEGGIGDFGGTKPSDMAAGGPSAQDIAPGGGGGETTQVQFQSGDTNITIEAPPGASTEELRNIVREEFRRHRAREKREIKEAIVKGSEQ